MKGGEEGRARSEALRASVGPQGWGVMETRVRWGELAPQEPDPLRMEVRKWVPWGRDSLTLGPHNFWDPGDPSAQGC